MLCWISFVHGEPWTSRFDHAQVEISKQIKDIFHMYCINDWQSEPHYQHQNPADRRYQNVKHLTNRLLNNTGAPPELWLLAMVYVCFILNRMALESLGWHTPLEALTGITPDISMVYRLKFWDKIYYKAIDSSFPSDSNELSGHFVGFSENVGQRGMMSQWLYSILCPKT